MILYIDASEGVDPLALLAALIDLGAAPSPVLSAASSLGLSVELRLDATGAALVPPLAGVLVKPTDVTALLARASLAEPARALAADAMGRLLLAVAMTSPGAQRFDVEVEAAPLVVYAAIAEALHGLAVERVACSRVGVATEPGLVVEELLADWAHAVDFGAGETSPEGAALLRALVGPSDVGAHEPRWRGAVARGACGKARVALGASD